MAHEAIPRAVRRQVRDRAGDRCEYRRHPAGDSCAPFVSEHVLPRVLVAGSTAEELARACPACNGHNDDKTRSRDPQTGRIAPLFNPRRQRWSRHFVWYTDFLRIEGRTATGRATVAALHLNGPALIDLRRALRTVGAHPPEAR